MKGEKLHKARMFKRWGCIPISVIWMASLFDAAVDVLFLPYDIYCVKKTARRIRSRQGLIKS